MKLTKEDYMRLPKERLAELLVERDQEATLTGPNDPIVIPQAPSPPYVAPCTPWWPPYYYTITTATNGPDSEKD